MAFRHAALWCGTAAVLILSGCGKGTDPSSVPTTTTVASGNYSGLAALNLVYVTFKTTSTGTIDATVDWTFSDDDIDLFLAKGVNPCTPDALNNDQCPFVATATSSTQKPEKISITNQPAGDYTLYIGNLGPQTEAISYQVFSTTTPAS